MKGWITDVLADYKKNKIVLWLKSTNGIVRKVTDDFHPWFYVKAYGRNADRVIKECESNYQVHSISYDEKIVELGKLPVELLKITLNEYRGLSDIVKTIRYHDVHNEIEVFNVDIDIVLSYLVYRGLFPMALVDFSNLQLRDNIQSIYYSIPSLSSAYVTVTISNGKISAVTIDDDSLEGTELQLLTALHSEISRKNPDILFINKGDTILPILYRKAYEYGISFTLGRENEISYFKKERSYFSYGRAMYSPPKCMLNGRIHIDVKHSFFYQESMLPGMIEMARLSCIPLQKLSRVTPGTAISAMQILEALRQNIVIKWKKNTPEKPKNAYTLFLADRGGMIYDPKVGIHENAYEIDFTSMYPNIMVQNNISPETVLCECCPESSILVPTLNYNICEKQKGLIPIVLQPLIKRRDEYKKLSRKTKISVYENRKNALKWVLVTCFGYTGYRNARFGRIECHEAINAYARESLVRAAHIAEDEGFSVLHGIIDSLWLKGQGDIDIVCQRIKKEIGIPIELEDKYRWIVFLPNKGNGAGSLTHYYGVTTNGSIKVRGLEIRRKDTPAIIKKCQKDILTCLAKAANSAEFMYFIDDCLLILKEYITNIRKGTCNTEDLVFHKTVTKLKDEYSQLNDSVACLFQLHDRGIQVHPGQRIHYIIKNASSKKYYKKVKLASDNHPYEDYDKEKYVSHLCKAFESLFLPFGYNENIVKKRINGLSIISI